jgi:3-methyladenine DNA glycosylase Tag
MKIMEAPPKIIPKSLADYLEVMSKAIMQTGISWRVVEAKWPGMKEAFFSFDPAKISHLTLAEIDALAEDIRIIRNRRKVEAIIGNAASLLELEAQYSGFQKYLRSFNSYELLVKDMRKRFKFLGEMGCYYFLWVVSEPVPSYEEWKEKYYSGKNTFNRR